MTDPNTPRPLGQQFIDGQKDAIITRAQDNGWEPLSRDPLILARGDKQIQVKFNGAGMPNGASWLHGDEFADMSAAGYMSMDTLYEWIDSDYGKDTDEHRD